MSERLKRFRQFMGAKSEDTLGNILRRKSAVARDIHGAICSRPIDTTKAQRIVQRLHGTRVPNTEPVVRP